MTKGNYDKFRKAERRFAGAPWLGILKPLSPYQRGLAQFCGLLDGRKGSLGKKFPKDEELQSNYDKGHKEGLLCYLREQQRPRIEALRAAEKITGDDLKTRVP